MPKAAADRPSRRLDAILAILRKHGIATFEAAELPGVGNGLKWSFGAAPAQEPAAPPARQPSRMPPRNPGPRDELDIVAEGREGPLDTDELDA